MSVDPVPDSDPTVDSGATAPRDPRPIRRGRRDAPTESEDGIVICWPDPSPLDAWWRSVIDRGREEKPS